MYSATRWDPENNWLSQLEIDKNDALAIYKYAFYFTLTTIMTVGYPQEPCRNYNCLSC